MIKISVIIPVYNARKFLNECLGSVCNQDISDIEVIAVDDGSTDGSGDILDKFAEKYDFFRAIHQENAGVSATRNRALKECKGEYVFFADADDILENGALKLLYDRAQSMNADMVIAGYSMFNNNMNRVATHLDRLLEMDSIDPHDPDLLKSFILWNKLFRRELIERENITFPKLIYSEDAVFTMKYVYRSKKICGLKDTVYRYRRFDQSGDDMPATGILSPRKVRDFIEAHKTILRLADEEVEKSNIAYFDEFNIKLSKTLIKQFLSHYFEIEDELREYILAELADTYNRLSGYGKTFLADTYPQYCEVMDDDIHTLDKKRFVSVVLYAEKEDQCTLQKTLKSIKSQNIPFYDLYLPEMLREQTKEVFEKDERIKYIPANTRKELWEQVAEKVDTKYILFASPRVYYTNLFFDLSIKYMSKGNLDFAGYAYHSNQYGFDMELQPSRETLLAVAEGEDETSWIDLEQHPYNKLYCLETLRKWQDLAGGNISAAFLALLKKGNYSFFHQGLVYYTEEEEKFWDEFIPGRKAFRVGTDSSGQELKKLLSRDEIKTDPVKIRRQIMPLKEKGGFAKRSRKLLNYAAKHPDNRVLFFSIRKDGELEGNAKALFPYIKGKKRICANRLPHSTWTTFLMKYYTLRSKVIVTDDYEKYLRYYKLRDDQRVIQLWHACGAFKMFGQYGTNISARSEKTTHMQYNLVSVSAENLRTVYADAFQIDVNHVQALGCPRTDLFFDEKYKKSIRQKIYKKYEMLKDKEVILYAPTFRDSEEGRSYFKPPVDFKALSESLLENQMLVICPHPLMENEIAQVKCDNILEIRDISTNDMMMVTDLLITDYSSVIFEFALTGKPMAFFCYDFDSYNRQFYLDYKKELPGEILRTQDELVKFLRSDERKVIRQEYREFIRKNMSACDGHSAERLAAVINGYMEN